VKSSLLYQILLWDNDGTVTGSKNPNDSSPGNKKILPGVKNLMQQALVNIIISGFKCPESESQNFDPKKIIKNFTNLMGQLPIDAAAFSPTIGGTECYLVIKKSDSIIIKEAHKDPRYKDYIGYFKKPDIGMFAVIQDLIQEKFSKVVNKKTTTMIGDTWHDQKAAQTFGINFIEAKVIHKQFSNKFGYNKTNLPL
jgi:hypothetical protein